MKQDAAAFWQKLEELLAASEVCIDRPKGTAHPRFPHCVYPVDYGYLKHTTAMDGEGIDVWRGSAAGAGLQAVLCTVDVLKRDAELKLLLDCTPAETQAVLEFHNASEYMKVMPIFRGQNREKENES